MPRKKTIDDKELIALINEFLSGPCNGDARKLKFPAIAEYVRQHGYPDFEVTTLRRTPAARNHIESLQSSDEAVKVANLVSYRSIDIPALLEANPTRPSLIKALTDIDMYYKTAADTAAMIIAKDSEKTEKIAELEDDLRLKTDAIAKLENTVAALKSELREKTVECNGLRDYIKDYVYPEIASELLVRDGLFKPKESAVIVPDALDRSIIQAETKAAEFSKPRVTFDSEALTAMWDKFGKTGEDEDGDRKE